MSQTRLSYLFTRLTASQANAAEKAELLDLLRDVKNEKEAELLLEGAWENFVLGEQVFTAQQSEILLEKIVAEKNKAVVVSIPASKNFKWIWAVAAVLVVFLAAGISWYLKEVKTTAAPMETMAVRYKNDVPPGGKKATLTLANGQVIVLDSAASGVLAQQGNTQVIKLADGGLMYTVNDKTSGEIMFNTMATPNGGKYEMGLPDGSKVWLNAASSITYPTVFTGAERRVKITGEVYFEIVHNAIMPFRAEVAAGKDKQTTVEVLGTHFNVNAYPGEDGIKTTLLQGAVKIISGPVTRELQPGQQAHVSATGQVNVVNDVDLEETMSWKNGMFYFKNAGIKTIMRQVERWYDVDVVYEGDIADRFVADISYEVPVSVLLKIMELTGRVHFKIDGRKITVMP